tara:strand:+ start:617 stop:784 length:168 start_codon:yes stop_codon:yes gene_type:complete
MIENNTTLKTKALKLWYSNSISTEAYYDIIKMIETLKLDEPQTAYPKAPEGYFAA